MLTNLFVGVLVVVVVVVVQQLTVLVVLVAHMKPNHFLLQTTNAILRKTLAVL
jgi:hypothetical protein